MYNIMDHYVVSTTRGDKVIIDVAGKPVEATLLRVIKSTGEYLVQLENGTRQALDGDHVFEYYEEFIDDLDCYNFKQLRGADLDGWYEQDSPAGVASLDKTVFWGGCT